MISGSASAPSTASGRGGSNFVLAIHAGAGGRLSRPVRDKTRALISKVLAQVANQCPADAPAVDVVALVVAAVAALEDSPLTNAGVGSNLNFDGNVECDASVCAADDKGGRSAGAVGALNSATNPVMFAENLRRSSLVPGPAGLHSPVLMTGSSPANVSGMAPTAEARRKWREYRTHLAELGHFTDNSVADTVGAICFSRGQCAAAASSGGNWLKPSGRLGAAAVPNAAVSVVSNSVVASSGNGERMVRDSFAMQVGFALNKDGLDSESGILNVVKDCAAGFVALRKPDVDDPASMELVFAHATPSFSYGFFAPSTMSKPIVVISRAAGDLCTFGARRVALRD